jgi:hypothetical protein
MKRLALVCGTVAVTMLSGCNLDINTDPTVVSEVTLNVMLAPIQLGIASSTYSIGASSSLYTQQYANERQGETDSHLELGFDDAFSTLYLTVLQNSEKMIQQAVRDNSPHYAGAGKVLQAMALGYATDVWENIPWTEALQRVGGVTPAYDSQERIYAEIQRLLGEAVTDLNQPASRFTLGNEDLMFRGNRTRWVRLAQTLRARYAIQLTAKGATTAANNALSALSANGGGLTAIDDDCQVSYDGARVLNPFLALANQTFTTRVFTTLAGNYWVSRMTSSNDPRLGRIINDNATGLPLASTFGAVAGTGAGPGTSGKNAYISTRSWFTTNPMQILNFAEAKFIEAEARFLANGGTATSVGGAAGTAAHTAFVDGVRANMTKLGVATTSANAYIAGLPTASNLRLSDIMLEKYEALFVHPSTWTDMRRYQFSTNVYTGFSLPVNQNPQANGQFPQRGIYPATEQARNGANVGANLRSFIIRMWRDSQ